MHVQQKVLLFLDNADDIIGKKVIFRPASPLFSMLHTS